MIVQVKLFAGAQQAAGRELVLVPLPDAATVIDLRQALVDLCPALAPWEPHLLIAVNQQYAADHQTLAADDELACFPPVSGG